jgi:exosome complex component CSL4
MPSVVIPGDILGFTSDSVAGPGTYVSGTEIRASLAGYLDISGPSPSSSSSSSSPSPSSSPPTLSVRGPATARAGAAVPRVGSVVVARVLRLASTAAGCEVLLCDGRALAAPFSAVVRREHVREGEVDKVRMDEAFIPGDLVQARVASMGDARSLFLSTAGSGDGVVYARSEGGRNVMRAVSATEMLDPVTGVREKRRAAWVAS